jgi:tRNA modification GTPase
LLGALALLEVSVDFPDEAEAPEIVNAPVLKNLKALTGEFEAALQDGKADQSIRDGFRVAIIGPPNVGKSTLLNRLAKREAAIVTDIPGTTRDVVEVRCHMAGQIVWFADTAGLRQTEDVVEAEGVRRAKRIAEESDLRLYVSTATGPPPLLPIAGPIPRAQDLHIQNKADLNINESLRPDFPGKIIKLSALTGDGFDALEVALETWLAAQVAGRTAPVITRARHRMGIEIALSHVKTACDLIAQDAGAELASEDVRLAARALAGLVGEIGVEEILGAVFSEFCIGK